MSFIKRHKEQGLQVVRLKKTLPIYLVESQLTKIYEKYPDLRINHGWGNGYVAIPKHHSLFGVDIDDLYNRGFNININGGLTLSGLDVESGKWLFGFDTAHSFNNEIEHDFEFVKNEAIKLRNFLFQDNQYQRHIKLKRLKSKINDKRK